jgi:hypothetical protein
MNISIKKAFIPIFLLILFFIMTGITEANYEGTIGTSFTITGAGFGAKKPKVFIEYESRPGAVKKVYAQVVNWSDASITCVWTKKLFPGTYNLWIKPNTKKIPPLSGGLFTIKPPTIERIFPTTLRNGSSITIYGYYFTNKKPAVYIEDLVTKKRIGCRVSSYSMNEDGKSWLSFDVPKGEYENCNIILKTLIGEAIFSITSIPPLTLTLDKAEIPPSTLHTPYGYSVKMTATGGVPPYFYDCEIHGVSGIFTNVVWNDPEGSPECSIAGAPNKEGTFIITFTVRDCGTSTAFHNVEVPFTVTPDTDIEKGFPVQTYKTHGQYYGGQRVYTLVGTVGESQQQKILFPGLPYGPHYAWNPDGSLVTGWPLSTRAQGFPAIGELSSSSAGNEVFITWGARSDYPSLTAFDDSGAILPGWPQTGGGPAVPTLADINNDGYDDIIMPTGKGLMVYKNDGTILPGWPIPQPYGLNYAVADLDGDGRLEIVSALGGGASITLVAYHDDGTPVKGFPVFLPDSHGSAYLYPVIGDVDGDALPEIILAFRFEGGFDLDKTARALVISGNGDKKCVLSASDSFDYASAPALADLDGDCIPEIILQTNTTLEVWKGDCSAYPGWPVKTGNLDLGYSSPVVGDVDGDQLPDIVVTTYGSGIWVFNRDGRPHPRFPKMPPIGFGAVPAIADIDRDGHNEIIISGTPWEATSKMYDTVWVYDLGGPPHGGIEWSQLGGSAKHQHAYFCTKNH